MESIESKAIVSPPTMVQQPAPTHTHPNHSECAYYVVTELIGDGPDVKFIEMECPHGFSAGGAFYSEDYVRRLKSP